MREHRTLALVCIGILLVAVVFAPVPGTMRLIRVLHDSAHGPIFGIVALLSLSIARRGRLHRASLPLQYGFAWFIAVLLGLATELAQIPVGRDASWLDARNDVLGATAFLAAYVVFDARLRGMLRERFVRITALLTAIVALTVLFVPLATSVAAYAHRMQRFPELAHFDGRLSTYFIAPGRAFIERMALPAPWAAQPGETALRVRFGSGEWPGIDVSEPMPDWRDYSMLAIDLVNPADEDLVIVVRVHDEHHNKELSDRFNQVRRIAPNTRAVVRIALADIAAAPQSRRMDMQRIAGIIIFAAGEARAREMYVVSVRLE